MEERCLEAFFSIVCPRLSFVFGSATGFFFARARGDSLTHPKCLKMIIICVLFICCVCYQFSSFINEIGEERTNEQDKKAPKDYYQHNNNCVLICVLKKKVMNEEKIYAWWEPSAKKRGVRIYFLPIVTLKKLKLCSRIFHKYLSLKKKICTSNTSLIYFSTIHNW